MGNRSGVRGGSAGREPWGSGSDALPLSKAVGRCFGEGYDFGTPPHPAKQCLPRRGLVSKTPPGFGGPAAFLSLRGPSGNEGISPGRRELVLHLPACPADPLSADLSRLTRSFLAQNHLSHLCGCHSGLQDGNAELVVCSGRSPGLAPMFPPCKSKICPVSSSRLMAVAAGHLASGQAGLGRWRSAVFHGPGGLSRGGSYSQM